MAAAPSLADLLRSPALVYEAKPRTAPLLRLPAELAPKARAPKARC